MSNIVYLIFFNAIYLYNTKFLITFAIDFNGRNGSIAQ